MSENILKKINYLVGILPIAAIFGMVAFIARIEIKDLDIWLHLAMGRFIALHKFVPSVDMLSNSISGHHWVNHEWLFQVILHYIYTPFGAEGLLTMQVCVVIFTMFLLLVIGYQKDNQIILTILLLLVSLNYSQRFTVRPDLFSLMFFTIFIFIMALHIDKKWSTPVLFITQVIWTNMHGFFFFGPLFVLLGIISEWMKRRVPLPYEWNQSGRLSDEEYSRLIKTFFLLIFACIINPGLLEGAWYPIGVFFSLGGESKIFFKYIQELQKPVTWDTLFTVGKFTYYKVLILLSVISFVFNRRRIDVSALFFWIIFLLFSLKALRNVPFFSFAAYLVIITNLLHINPRDIIPVNFNEPKFNYITQIFIKLFMLVWIMQFTQTVGANSYYDFDKYDYKSEFGGVTLRGYPDKAMDFLIEHDVNGNFINDFNSGAYMLGRAHPDIKVFIDGRTEVYGPDFFKQYIQIWEKGNKDVLDKVVEEYNITGALLNSSRHRIPRKIIKLFYNDPNWKPVYFNYDAVVFLRDVPQHKDVIKEFEIDLVNWQPIELDIFKVGAKRIKPYQHYYRAYTLESLDLDDAAYREVRYALDIQPGYGEAYQLLGKLYGTRGEYKMAFESFRRALLFNPTSKDSQYNLALSYMDLKKYEEAIQQYKIIAGIWPTDAKAQFFLAKAHILSEKYNEALPYLSKASQLDPDAFHDFMTIADTFFSAEAYQEALYAYSLAEKVRPDEASIYHERARVYLKLGDNSKALSEIKRAVELNPDSEEYRQNLEEISRLESNQT